MNPKFLIGDRKNPRNVIALYGVDRSSTVLHEVFKVTESIIRRTGNEPNVLGLRHNGGFGKYKRIAPQHLHSIHKAEIAGFSLAYVPSGDTDAANSALIKGETFSSAFVFEGALELLLSDRASIVKVVREISNAWPVEYGYQFIIDRFYGPSIHAIGMFVYHLGAQSLPKLPPDEVRRTGEWSRRHKDAIRTAALRDVFPINILSKQHLERNVGDVPLGEWITRSKARGSLESITPTLWAWTVSDDQCFELGNILEAAGLLA